MKNILKKTLDYLALRISSALFNQIYVNSAQMHVETKEHPISFPAGPTKTPVVFVHNTYGQRVFLDPADYFICTHYLEHLDWEDHLEDVYQSSLSNGGTYLDIGGNIGLHVLRAHRLGAQNIYAFEPNPNTFHILSMNMKLNGMHKGFFNTALGEKNGVIGMNITDFSAGMAQIQEDGEGLLQVPIETLNTFSDSHTELKTQKLSLIKIDVEGHEGEVINGALDLLKQHSDFNIIIEFGSPSSVNAVKTLDQNFTFSMKLYRWMQNPVEVDMSFVNDEKKIQGGDLVLFGLQSRLK